MQSNYSKFLIFDILIGPPFLSCWWSLSYLLQNATRSKFRGPPYCFSPFCHHSPFFWSYWWNIFLSLSLIHTHTPPCSVPWLPLKAISLYFSWKFPLTQSSFCNFSLSAFHYSVAQGNVHQATILKKTFPEINNKVKMYLYGPISWHCTLTQILEHCLNLYSLYLK